MTMLRPVGRRTMLFGAALLLLALPGFARTISTLNGTVVTVSAAAGTVSVSTGNGLVTLSVGPRTQITRNGARATLPNLAPRDTLQARFNVRTSRALSLSASGAPLVTVRGTVAGVSASSQGITINARGGSRSFAIGAQTIVSRNGALSTLSRITLQDAVTVHVAAGSTTTTAADVEADGPEEASVEGTISGINGTDVTIQPHQGSDVTVHTDVNTLFTVDEASATLADLATGMQAEAEYDPLSFDAFSIHAETAETQHQEVAGTIASVDTTAMTITINPANGGAAVMLNVTSTTQITLDDQAATLAQLAQGDHVSAQYDSSMNALQIEASSQEQHGTEIEGTASNVSATGLTVTPEHGAPVTLTINAQTQILLADGSTGTAADIQNGDRVNVSYDASTMTALTIQDQGQEGAPPPNTAEIEGAASNVSATGITVTPEEGSAVNLTIDSSTQIFIGDQAGSAADIQDGAQVEARYNPSTMVATRIEVSSESHH